MGKRTDSLSNRVHGKTWPNLYSYEIGAGLKEFMEGKQGRESESRERKRERGVYTKQGHWKCVNVCISSDLFVTYSTVLADSSLR